MTVVYDDDGVGTGNGGRRSRGGTGWLRRRAEELATLRNASTATTVRR